MLKLSILFPQKLFICSPSVDCELNCSGKRRESGTFLSENFLLDVTLSHVYLLLKE